MKTCAGFARAAEHVQAHHAGEQRRRGQPKPVPPADEPVRQGRDTDRQDGVNHQHVPSSGVEVEFVECVAAVAAEDVDGRQAEREEGEHLASRARVIWPGAAPAPGHQPHQPALVDDLQVPDRIQLSRRHCGSPLTTRGARSLFRCWSTGHRSSQTLP